MTDEVLKTDEISKKRGAPPGNQYARTHDFYK
jgi:hypothetical protein